MGLLTWETPQIAVLILVPLKATSRGLHKTHALMCGMPITCKVPGLCRRNEAWMSSFEGGKGAGLELGVSKFAQV